MTSLLEVLNARRAASGSTGEANHLISSASSVSGRSARNLGTLSREGILASHSLSQRIISDTHTVPHTPRSSRPPTPSLSHTHAHGHARTERDAPTQHSLWAQLQSRREQWRELGEGWWQTTSAESGTVSRAGLHSIVESSPTPHRLFACVYLPRSASAAQVISGENPEFDLELCVKLLPRENTHNTSSSSSFALNSSYSFASTNPTSASISATIACVIFAFRSAQDFCVLKCDAVHKLWLCVHVLQGVEHVLAHAVDESLRYHIFYALLVQIRGGSVSIDVNGVPLFTGVRCGSGSGSGGSSGDGQERAPREFNGLLGLAVLGGRFALKGWKLRGQVSRSSSSSSAHAQPVPLIHSVEEVRSSQQSSSLNASRSSRLMAQPRTAVSDERERERERGEQSAPRTVNALSAAENNIPHPPQSQLLRQRLEGVLSESFEKCIVDCVLSELISVDVGVSFDDIASLTHAKRILHEAIVLPTIMPEFFTGIREPWKGVLLYGPPGTGKTMLAKATCSLKKATFFSCSASSLISKYRGDSEKIIRCLFTAARYASPSVIFLDEIDALASRRSSDGEHEASRRMKTELFAQIDGLTSKVQGNNSVVVLAATNIPWELDLAMLRRLEKRIYIPLPDAPARLNCFQLFLKGMQLRADVDLHEMTRLTEGYSGADLQILCRDAAMMPMRRLLEICSIEDLEQMKREGSLANPTIAMADFLSALQNVRKTIPVSILERYAQWESTMGSK